MTSYRNIFKATSLFGGVQMFNILINLVRTKFVAVILGPTGVGLNGIYNETRELLHTTTNLGLDVSGVRGISQAFESGDAEEIHHQVTLLRSWVLLLALLGTLVCMLLAQLLSLFTFGDYNHIWGYVILSPAVGFSTITCGELGVLKGLRKLKSLATVSAINVIIALTISVPIYYVWGITGVLASLVLCTFCWMLSAIIFGYKAHKPAFSFSKEGLRGSRLILGIGTTFVICEIINHIAKLSVQSYLNNMASLDTVGLYNACITMTVTYAGMVFAAMEQDYFPRLSGVVNNIKDRTEVISKQLDVTLVLLVPTLILFILLMPITVPLLLSSDFSPIESMAKITACSLVFRSIYLLLAYLPLAAGDSKIYFLFNILGALNTFWIILGYMLGGLIGIGIAIFAENLIDLLMALCLSKWKYKISLPRKTKILMATGCLLVFVVCASTFLV